MKITLKNATPSYAVMRRLGLYAKHNGLPRVITPLMVKDRKPC